MPTRCLVALCRTADTSSSFSRAFGLTTLIGLERTIQGKGAGLRTQTIVGTSSALILLISNYGFGDVLAAGTIVLDPPRVAAQIVSRIGFLGAGIIITRRGAVHGLITAAAVWESARCVIQLAVGCHTRRQRGVLAHGRAQPKHIGASHDAITAPH